MATVPTGQMDFSYRGDDPERRVTDDAHVTVCNASPESVATVLNTDPNLDDGFTRSQWVWVRFPNGDLILATFPQDETYFATEGDQC